MARTKQKARKEPGAGTVNMRMQRGEAEETAKKDWDELTRDEFSTRQRGAREVTKQNKLNQKANKAARAKWQDQARVDAAYSQPSQQNDNQNQNQNQGSINTASLTRKQRRKLKAEQSGKKNKTRASFAEEEQAARQPSRSEFMAEYLDDIQRPRSGGGRAKKGDEGDDEYMLTEKDRTMAGDETPKRITRSQTFTLPQRPAKRAADHQQQNLQNQGESSKTPTTSKPDLPPQAEPSQPKQKKNRKKRTPEELRLRSEKIEKRALKRQEKKKALRAARLAEEIASKKALESLPNDIDNTQSLDPKELARATLSPTTVEILAEEDRRLAHSAADKIKGKARKEARKAFEVAESVRYQELKEKGSVLADWELMKGRSTFPLDFWEDLAGTKMAAMSRGVGMYL